MTQSVYDIVNTDIDNIPYFSFDGNVYECKIFKVIDGDSIKGIIYFNNNFYKINFRLYGIDTCELRDKDSEKKELAYKAKSRVEELINECTGNIVKIECKHDDKYGRILAIVHLPNRNDTLNNILLNEKFAKEYYGGTK